MTDTLNGHQARTPITDPAAWMDDLGPSARTALRALGELLLGVSDAHRAAASEDADQFTRRALGGGALVDEIREMAGVERLTWALALAELIEEHAAEVGPGRHINPPSWTVTEVGDTSYRHPSALRAAFPAGTLAGAPCVVAIGERPTYGGGPILTVHTRGADQPAAAAVLERVAKRAAQLHPYRGRVCRASIGGMGGLVLEVVDLPASLTRDTVVVDAAVWREIDLGVAATTTQREMLNAHGLGSRRGVLLVGPPGTGKSAVSAVVARELAGRFTVVYVEARAGASLLTAVVEEAKRLGGPCLLILEDLDLWCRDRREGSSGGLSELLQAMDIASDAAILTIASTNDAATLDAAAIRTGRFDSIVEVGYPGREASATILSTLTTGIPGGEGVDAGAVAGRLPERTSGSDLREIVRRAVLSGDGGVSTAGLLGEVGSGRYRAAMPGEGGQYL